MELARPRLAHRLCLIIAYFNTDTIFIHCCYDINLRCGFGGSRRETASIGRLCAVAKVGTPGRVGLDGRSRVFASIWGYAPESPRSGRRRLSTVSTRRGPNAFLVAFQGLWRGRGSGRPPIGVPIGRIVGVSYRLTGHTWGILPRPPFRSPRLTGHPWPSLRTLYRSTGHTWGDPYMRS